MGHRLRVLVPDRENSIAVPNDRNVALDWEAPADQTVQQLRVEWSKDGGPWVVRGTYAPTVTQHAETGLLALVGYRFRVVSLYASTPEIPSLSADCQVPLLQSIEVRTASSTFGYPLDFTRWEGTSRINCRHFNATYDLSETIAGETTIT